MQASCGSGCAGIRTISPGTRKRAGRRAGLCPSPLHGGFIFAEHPGLAAPDARILWDAALDPGTLAISVRPAIPGDPDSLILDHISPWLTCVEGPDGLEHAVLSDGWHHIRLDVTGGRLAGQKAVHLHYRLHGLTSARSRMLPLRRFLGLCQYRRFGQSLFPSEPQTLRWLDMLRVHDAVQDGASQREIASTLFGEARIADDWNGPSDSLRSRVRRLVRDARAMAAGGYRNLLRRS